MNKVSFIKSIGSDGIEVEHAIIEHADGGFTSMLKSTYDAMQAEQSTPNLAE
jgi:hypothetical protein